MSCAPDWSVRRRRGAHLGPLPPRLPARGGKTAAAQPHSALCPARHQHYIWQGKLQLDGPARSEYAVLIIMHGPTRSVRKLVPAKWYFARDGEESSAILQGLLYVSLMFSDKVTFYTKHFDSLLSWANLRKNLFHCTYFIVLNTERIRFLLLSRVRLVLISGDTSRHNVYLTADIVWIISLIDVSNIFMDIKFYLLEN